MWAWCAAALTLVAIVVAGVNLDFIRHPKNVYQSFSIIITVPLKLSSSVFTQSGPIPAKFTCDGDQVNPPLSIGDVPTNAKSLVLIMDDPDVPKQLRPDGVFDHWILFNIPPETMEIATGTTVGVPGANGAGKAQYTGPCPPKQYEPSEHRYFFKLYALDTMLDLPSGASKSKVQESMQGHVIGQAELMGTYKRP